MTAVRMSPERPHHCRLHRSDPVRSRLPLVYDNRGVAYLMLGQLGHAIADFEAALKLDPKQARPLHGRGVAKLKKGDAAGGREFESLHI